MKGKILLVCHLVNIYS